MVEKIPFKEWQKLDIRTAKILEVKDHPNADRLYVLKVDLGNEQRELVAGLKQHYTPEQLKGRTIVMITNLEPAIKRGVKSDGMLLAAVNDDRTKIRLLQPDDDIEIGSRIS